MNRKIYYWKLCESEMQLGERTLIMGVLNITPDSFSDGGRFNDPDRAYARALELEEQGVDIIDLGAESTKPGSQRVTADEEWQRLVPVLKRFRGNLRVPLSLDTYKSEIAERALQYGVEIFNDPTGLTFDPDMAKIAANGNAGLILNHMRGQPETWAKLSPMQDPAGMIARELEATANRARHAGVERGRIVIDPGLGFGKRKEQNAEILAHLQQLAGLDYPILVGPSRKSFLAQPSEKDTLYATAAAVTAAVLNGAHIVRVHDVQEMRVVVQVADGIAHAAAPKPVSNVEERPQSRPRSKTGPNFDAERPRPPRPPIMQRPMEQPILPAAIEASTEPRAVEYPKLDRAKVDRPRYDRNAPSYPDRDKRDGSRPPVSRPFTPRRPADRSGPPRGRDFRPGQSKEGASAGPSKGPKRPFVRDDRPPHRHDRDEPRRAAGRSGPTSRPGSRPDNRRFKPSEFKPKGLKPSGPKRAFDRGTDSLASRTPGRSEHGSVPPQGDRPPKRPFRKRP